MSAPEDPVAGREPAPTAALDEGLGAVLTAPERARGPELDRLIERLAEGQVQQAQRDASRLAEDPAHHAAVLAFDLIEAAGRRSARRLLRWVRQEERTPGTHGIPADAWAPLRAWAHFRLWRHGRALALTDRSLARDGVPGAALWCAVLDGMRRSALRQGYLRLAQRAHERAERAAEAAGSAAPDRPRAAEDMAAVHHLMDRHRDHGLPTSLARYLARTLGQRQGDSPNGAAEIARDLSLTPDDLEAAIRLAEEHGFADRVQPRLQTLGERFFQGNWRTRRRVQRGLLWLLWTLLALGLAFGLTVLRYAL